MGIREVFKKRPSDEACDTKVLVACLESKLEEVAKRDLAVYVEFYSHSALMNFGSIQELLREIGNRYDVIHLFCDVSPAGKIVGQGGEHIAATVLLEKCIEADVKVLWVASENRPEGYVKGFKGKTALNLVMTIERKGETFTSFLKGLVRQISAGESMPTAWVSLAPENSNDPRNRNAPSHLCGGSRRSQASLNSVSQGAASGELVGDVGALYSLGVEKTPGTQTGPARGLYLGLAVTILAVLLYAAYITMQFAGLRQLQSDMVDRNRKDSLQLLRIQNDLNTLGLAMDDMLDSGASDPLTAWTAQFDRLKTDLDDAMEQEAKLAQAAPTSEQRHYLLQALRQFWDASDRMFGLAAQGKEKDGREQIRDTLQPRQAALTSAVSRLLVQNNEAEEAAALRITGIYNRVQRQLYFFLAAILLAIVTTSLYLIGNNRKLFARAEELSSQRSELAHQLISTQESTLRHISRELHDEFGQVLTAIGSLLKRTGKHVPENSPLHGDLQEVREIAQATLNNIRSLSQALHPVLLDEAGLESTLDWYIPTVERQTGLALHYEKTGEPFAIEASAGVQIYRVVQEALNNVSRHSGAKEAWVRLRFQADRLELDVEDHGKGFAPMEGQTGIGLVAMRERAEILGGTLRVAALNGLQAGGAGTIVKLRIPRAKVETHGE